MHCERCGSPLNSDMELEAASDNGRVVVCDSCVRLYYDNLGKPTVFQWGIAIGVVVSVVGLIALGAIGAWLAAG